MNKSHLLQKFAITGLAGMVGVIGLQASASAAFLGNFEGYSVFGVNDQGGTQAPTVCPLCDSTVSFAVWENTDGNWIDDLTNQIGASPSALANSFTGAEDYVFLYQVVNTDPLPQTPPDPSLGIFNVTKTTEDGAPIADQPYTSAGYFSGRVFENASSAETPLDTPNNWEPTMIETVRGFTDGGVDPIAAQLPPAGSFQISSDGVRNATPYDGALFQWTPNQIPANGGTSSLVFLTANKGEVSIDGVDYNQELGFVWAESQEFGGTGAAGDVPGIKNVPVSAPEPMTVLGLMVVCGLGLGLKHKKQYWKAS